MIDDSNRELLARHVDRHQQVVGRLAANSAQIKAWTVTIAAGIATVAAIIDDRRVLLIGVVAGVALGLLDAWYLALERHFREASDRLVDRVYDGTAAPSDLFKFDAPRLELASVARATRSWSVLPFYAAAATVLLVGFAAS